jgi:peptide/nickel transport system permease protein
VNKTVSVEGKIPHLTVDDIESPPLSLSQLTWRRFRRHKMAIFGTVVIFLLILYVFVGATIYSQEYANHNDPKLGLTAPSTSHPFGTDPTGRDVLARSIYAGQISLMIGLIAALIETSVGVVIGALAGYYGGWIDAILMRITEAMLTIPEIVLLIVMAKEFGGKFPSVNLLGREFSGSVVVIVIIIGLTSWMYLARIVRAEFLSIKESDFILAARSTGTSNFGIIFRHILPNSIAPIIVSATLGIANAILAEAYVSFFGLGVQPPTATWGNMLDGANNYLDTAPWLWFFPGILILFTVLSINFLGDGLRDALDPHSRAV